MASTLIANEIPGLGKLIEIPELNEVLQRLNEAVGITTAVDDLGGNALAVSGFQKLCRFHRDNPETCERCRQSDQSLLEQARSNRGYATQQCMNGLVDATAPIHVGGEHLANVFTGQALNEPPDLEAL